MTKTTHTVRRRHEQPRRGPVRWLALEVLEVRALLATVPVTPVATAMVTATPITATSTTTVPVTAATPLLIQLRDGTTAFPIPLVPSGDLTLKATGIAGLVEVSGSSSSLGALKSLLGSQPTVRYIEPLQTVSVTLNPNDPSYVDGSQWGLNGSAGIQAPGAWNVTTGSTSVTVAAIDTGVDYDHPDLYDNIWINQPEIPASRRANLVDVDGDGLITFYDLNYHNSSGVAVNQGPGKITDVNGDGVIDAADLLAPMTVDGSGNDTGGGGWVNPDKPNTQDGDTAHPDDLVGWNFITNTNNPADDHGHGTHTAGTVGAMTNNSVGVAGVNWVTQLMVLKMIDSTGNGTDLQAAQAIYFAADHGARVGNASWGGYGFSQVMSDAIAYAQSKGVILVAAAGNDVKNNDNAIFYPASDTHYNVISVAALASDGSRAGFSNYGPLSVKLAAPGEDIYSTIPVSKGSYGYSSGTSMAAPHVTGVVALVAAAHPSWTYTQIVNQVLATVTPLTSVGTITLSGGEVNAAAAVGPAATQLIITAVNLDATGFAVRFNEPIDTSVLHLYTNNLSAYTNSLGAPDVSLTLNGVTVRGSLVVDSDNMGFHFVKTGGPLAAGSYLLTIRGSGLNAIRQAGGGGALAGGPVNVPGTDFQRLFSANTSTVYVGVPSFERGPGQTVNIPASGTGLPVQMYNPSGVQTASFVFHYDTSRLTVTGATLAAGLPAGTTMTTDTSVAGQITLNITFGSALTGTTTINIASLTASVPTTALYGTKERVWIDSVDVNAGNIDAAGDSSVHVVSYPGDVNASKTVNTIDVGLINRLIVGLDTGLPNWQMVDPYLIADFNGDGKINTIDVNILNAYIVGSSQSYIPPQPSGITIVQGGPDPLVSLPQGLTVVPGGHVAVPVNLLQTSTTTIGLNAFDLAIAYDPAAFTIASVKPGSLAGSFSLTWTTSAMPGLLYVTAARTAGATTLVPAQSGTLAVLDLVARPGAAHGASTLNLLDSVYAGGLNRSTRLNDGALTLSPAPTNAANDPVDGRLVVTQPVDPTQVTDRTAVTGVIRSLGLLGLPSTAAVFGQAVPVPVTRATSESPTTLARSRRALAQGTAVVWKNRLFA